MPFYLDLEVKLESLRTAGTAVLAVCAVMGTTEESAIDDVDEILNIRDRRCSVHYLLLVKSN